MDSFDAVRLQQLESMCEMLYNPATPAPEKTKISESLMVFSSSPEYLPHCKYMLSQSNSPYAQYLGASSLLKLITRYWNDVNLPQRIELRKLLKGIYNN